MYSILLCGTTLRLSLHYHNNSPTPYQLRSFTVFCFKIALKLNIVQLVCTFNSSIRNRVCEYPGGMLCDKSVESIAANGVTVNLVLSKESGKQYIWFTCIFFSASVMLYNIQGNKMKHTCAWRSLKIVYCNVTKL